MPQTAKERNGTPQKQVRPGQRQQERLMRLARRRRRRRIWTASITAVILIAIASVSIWQFQQYQQRVAAQVSATQTAISNKHATATVVVANANATATVAALPATPPAVNGTPVALPDGLKYIDIQVGSGTAAQKGSTVSVQYTGWLESTGKRFDSSYLQGGKPFSLQLGQSQVIKGWDEGLVGMKPGGIRRLIIPPSLGYGPQGSGPIPPNATLIFDVMMVSVQ
jgi:FKBP-type peptidyl-prolyl cis-trans isomerase